MDLVVTQPIRALERSFSRPWLVKCENIEYVLKFFDGNNNSLASEFICNKIAKKIGLTVPETSPVLVEQDEVDIINARKREQGDFLIHVGKYFGSKFIENPFTLNTERHASLDSSNISNLEQVAGMTAFDIFVDNGNRCAQNALMHPINEEGTIFEYVLIDQGHCFHDPNWDANSIKNIGYNPKDIPWKKDLIVGETSFKKFIDALDSIGKSEFKEIIDEVPQEWKPRPDDFKALLDFLDKRSGKEVLRTIRNMAKNNIKLFSNWN